MVDMQPIMQLTHKLRASSDTNVSRIDRLNLSVPVFITGRVFVSITHFSPSWRYFHGVPVERYAFMWKVEQLMLVNLEGPPLNSLCLLFRDIIVSNK